MDANSTKLANIPAGLMPTQAEVLSIQNNTRTTIGLPTVAERPDAGSTQLKIYLNNYDTIGNMEAPDSAPTVAVVNEAGTTRSGNLQHPTTHVPQTTMVNLSVGRYWIEYDLDVADSLESLVFTFSIIEGGVTRIIDRVMLVVDTTAVDFTAADRTKLDTLHDTRIPGVIQPQTGDSFARLGAPTGASVSADVASVAGDVTSTLADTNELQTDWKDTGRLDTLLDAIKVVTDALGSTAAANLALAAGVAGIIPFTAQTGTLSTTQATTDLSEATTDHYKGRIILWTSGVLAGQATDITAYSGTGGLLTFTALTEAPSNADTGIIV